MRAQREAFLTYHAIRLSIRIMHNPRYVSRTTFTASDKYVLSYLNPYTGKPYSDGRIVSVDPEGNPDDIEESVYEVALMNVDIIEHLLEVFHETVQQGSQEIPLTRLVQPTFRTSHTAHFGISVGLTNPGHFWSADDSLARKLAKRDCYIQDVFSAERPRIVAVAPHEPSARPSHLRSL